METALSNVLSMEMDGMEPISMAVGKTVTTATAQPTQALLKPSAMKSTQTVMAVRYVLDADDDGHGNENGLTQISSDSDCSDPNETLASQQY